MSLAISLFPCRYFKRMPPFGTYWKLELLLTGYMISKHILNEINNFNQMTSKFAFRMPADHSGVKL